MDNIMKQIRTDCKMEKHHRISSRKASNGQLSIL